jgi:hypothetical protein
MPRYVNYKDTNFEFPDDIADIDAMEAIDKWDNQQSKYTQDQVNKFGKMFTDYASDVMSGKKLKQSNEHLEKLIDRVGSGKGTLDDFMEFVSPGMMVGAKVIPKTLTNKFAEKESNGFTKDELWKEMGMFRGPDGKIRAELSDHESSLISKNFSNKGAAVTSGEGKLDNYFAHDKLYAMYPELKNMDVSIDINPKHVDKEVRGEYLGDKINVWAKDPVDARETLLHEVQHHVQSVEEFAFGGSPEMLSKTKQNLSMRQQYLQSKYNDIGEEHKKPLLNEIKRIQNVRQKLNKSYDEFNDKDAAYKYYRDLYGEIEASNTGSRRYLTPEERRADPPWRAERKPEGGHKLLQGHR